MHAVAPPLRPSHRLRSLRVITALILREITTSNMQSLLGYLWEVIEPVIFILFLMFLFTLFVKRPPIGDSFALFYASGLLPYMAFLRTVSQVGGALRQSRALLSYPGVTFLDAILARFVLAALTKTLVFVAVLALVCLGFGVDPFFDVPQLVLGMTMSMLLALALGTANCLLVHVLPLWDRLWGLVTRPLMLLSAVIYLFETVPLPYRDWLWWNPVVHMVGAVRAGVYPTYDAAYVSVTYVALLVGVLLPVSLFFLRRYWRDIVSAD
jgi:capsular polysaccharide transport system permease protein